MYTYRDILNGFFKFRLQTPIVKPLVVFFEWYNAQPNHVAKYAEMYINQQFDVVAVRFSNFDGIRQKRKIQV